MIVHLEIVVTGVQDHPHVVDVRVEVVQQVSVVDVGQLLTGLHTVRVAQCRTLI